MTDKPSVVPIGAKDDLLASLEALKRTLPHMVEHAAIVAAVKRSYFDALVKEGFSEAQALEIIQSEMTI